MRAGREVGKIAAERIIPLTLELGGKSPDIVFADADLKQAVPGALRAFVFNSTRSDFMAKFSQQDKRTEFQTSIPQALALMNSRLVTDATSVERGEVLCV